MAPGEGRGIAQSAMTGPCGQTMSGGVVSRTMTLNEHSEALPEWSIALQRTTDSPTGNAVPEGGSQAIAGSGSHVSVALTENETGVPFGELHSARMSAGQVKMGGCVSLTVMRKLHSTGLPPGSVVEQVTVVVPIGKTDPDGGLHVGAGGG